MLQHYIAAGLGGAIGSVARVFVGKLLPLSIVGVPFPILFINIVGCFSMGAIAEALTTHWQVSDNMRYFIFSGLLGGFTTFSAFTLDVGLLYEKNQIAMAVVYAGLSFGLSIGFFFVGMRLVKSF